MNVNLENLLQPITEENPCGKDISDETDFYMLEELAKGKQETQFSAAEPPNWKEVINLALTLFGQSKDLWIAYYILCGMVNLNGDDGMVKGFGFLEALLKKFWDLLNPKLDKDSDMPALQRINAIKDVFSMQGLFVTGVNNITLTKSGIGSFRYRDIINSGKDDQLPTEDTILAAISDSDKEFLESLKSNLKKTQELALSIKSFLQDKGITPEFEESFELFISMINTIEKYLDVNNNTIKDEQTEALNASNKTSRNKETPARGKNIADQISNYQDIIKMLRKICQWYEENEPSSPVPLFLNKAESLVGKSFVDIVNDVASSAMKDISLLYKTEKHK